jgi:glutamate synthase (NADPH/NADH) small chain
MADPQGFLRRSRQERPKRPVEVRVQDWQEVYTPAPQQQVRAQAGRCMDCGVAFCHAGCPLGNVIPDWNDLVWRGNWEQASISLHATNNFPEFTGRLCPAPCEAACVLSINSTAPDQRASGGPVTIKHVEQSIADQAWADGSVKPQPPEWLTDKTVGIVGSGPAGLAAAQQLTRAGHTVVVYERDDRIGGLLRYGIPDFKQDRQVLQRRLDQMRAEGTQFRANVEVGVDLTGQQLLERHDAVLLTVGALRHRELDVPGRELEGIYPAMQYLTQANRVVAGDLAAPPIDARGKRVLIVGGGDTGADCLGTATRQGAAHIVQLQINARPLDASQARDQWPSWPLIFRTAPAYEEGGQRLFALSTQAFLGDEQGHVRAAQVHEVSKLPDGSYQPVPGSEQELAADLVLLALGFSGPQDMPLLEQLGLERDRAGRLQRDEGYHTSTPGVFVAGDAGRGASLVVWAIAEGRAAAASIDTHLRGQPSPLPVPVLPSHTPLAV